MCNLDYSIDKVKLYIHGVKINEVQHLMDVLSLDVQVKPYESNKVTACRYNYSIKENDTVVFGERIKGNTFYLGIEPNWSRDKNKTHRDIVVEYNPNKIILADFDVLNSMLPINEYKTEILTLDIAIDIFNQHMQDLLIYKRHGSERMVTIAHNKLETVYLGSVKENGHIKVYNKAKEQKLNNDTIWTRYEITYKKLGFMDIRDTKVIEETKLAEIKIKNDTVNLDVLKDTERYIFLTSLDNVEKINMLGRVMKKKILNYHEQYLKKLDINLGKIIEVYKNFKVV